MEVHLDRKLSEKRIFPAIDINKSGTRKEELILDPDELECMWAIRKSMSNANNYDFVEQLLKQIVDTKTNKELITKIKNITK